MKLMGKSLHPNKALEIYNGIEDKLTKVHPSVCNSVLGCLIKSGKLKNNFDMFRRMKQDGLVPDVVTYSTVVPKSKMVIQKRQSWFRSLKTMS
nr:pentatricopeptide repeat-containing protein At1g10910, chloroplastic [Tanacetum cinerariifolium]